MPMNNAIERDAEFFFEPTTGQMIGYRNPRTQNPETLVPAGAAVLNYRRAGNITTGVGADLVFSGAGGAGFGKFNLGQDLLIPANTIVPGQSIIKAVFNIRRTGTDASFFDIRFGTTNGTADGSLLGGSSIQFNAGTNPQDVQLELFVSATANRLTTEWRNTQINVGATAGNVGEIASLNFAVDNYINLAVSGTTTGSYRCVSYELQVFQ